MKFLKIALVSCLLLIAVQSVAFAGSGKAVVPFWFTSIDEFIPQDSEVYISNITQHDLKVIFTAYDSEGNVVSSVTYNNFANSNSEIAAGKSAQVTIRPTSGEEKHGYAVIEWSNKDQENDFVGLVSCGSSPRLNSITVNNGVPF